MSEAAVPKIHRSTLVKFGGCPAGFEEWMVENGKAVIIEDVKDDGNKN